MLRRESKPSSVADPQIDDTRLVHVHLAGLKVDGEAHAAPLCLEFSGRVFEADKDLGTFLRGLRDKCRANNWPRLDEIVVAQAPEILARLDRLVREALQSGTNTPLVDLLGEWPLAFLHREVCRRLADGVGDRSIGATLKAVGSKMLRQLKGSPRAEARSLRDRVDALDAEYRQSGRQLDRKALLLEVDPG